METFSDAKIVKDCLLALSNTLFQTTRTLNRQQRSSKATVIWFNLCQKNGTQDLFWTLIGVPWKCIFLSLALDLSTHLTSTSKLILFVIQWTTVGFIKEEFFYQSYQGKAKPLAGAENVYFEKHELELEKLVTVFSCFIYSMNFVVCCIFQVKFQYLPVGCGPS